MAVTKVLDLSVEFQPIRIHQIVNRRGEGSSMNKKLIDLVSISWHSFWIFFLIKFGIWAKVFAA